MSSGTSSLGRSLGNSISALLKTYGIEKKVKEYQVIVEWPEIVGKKISKASKAEKVVDEILFIKVKNSAWRTELLFMKNQILKKIDEKVGVGIIKDIRFI